MGSKKLSDEDVRAIRASTDSVAVLADQFGISEYYVFELLAGRARSFGVPSFEKRQLNRKDGGNGLWPHCRVCPAKLRRFETNGEGRVFEICSRGHAILIPRFMTP